MYTMSYHIIIIFYNKKNLKIFIYFFDTLYVLASLIDWHLLDWQGSSGPNGVMQTPGGIFYDLGSGTYSLFF